MPNLLFLMTPGVGLNVWKNIGSLNRELKPYMEYMRRGWKVKILTFDKGDIPELPEGIEAIRFQHPHLLWFLPWTNRKLGEWADIIKTNQSAHAYYYTYAARIWKRPILLRCGYVHGEFLETTQGLTPKTKFYQWLEKKAFQKATLCQVPTEELSKWVQTRYDIPKSKISVVPNFVDTDIFKPIAGVPKKEKSVISVGRLHPVKRFDFLIKACAEIPGCELTLVGEGPENPCLQQLAREFGLKLNLPGNIPNESLPKIIQSHIIFAMTSEWEGHPKALIEAMACGIPVLGVHAIGISNIIQHGENGIVVEPHVEDIKDGLNLLFSDNVLREKVSHNARKFALTNYSFENVMEKDFNSITLG